MINCYNCKHRQKIPGDAHSECKHPKADGIGLMAILIHGRADYKSGLKVAGEPEAIKNGHFMWPFNYDPIWLRECNGFEE